MWIKLMKQILFLLKRKGGRGRGRWIPGFLNCVRWGLVSLYYYKHYTLFICWSAKICYCILLHQLTWQYQTINNTCIWYTHANTCGYMNRYRLLSEVPGSIFLSVLISGEKINMKCSKYKMIIADYEVIEAWLK